jgi:hypothetical protein
VTETVDEAFVGPILVLVQRHSIQDRRDLASCLRDEKRVRRRRAADQQDPLRIWLEGASQRVGRRKRQELPTPDDIRGERGEIEDGLERASVHDRHVREHAKQLLDDEFESRRSLHQNGVRPKAPIFIREITGDPLRTSRRR